VRRFLFFFVFLSAATAAFGQYTSDNNLFQVDEVKGCVPFTINITNPDLSGAGRCVPGQACFMDFEGAGNGGINLSTFTYNTPGEYILSIQYQGGEKDQIKVTVVENPDPTFEVYTCTGNQVSIKVTDKSHDTYIIDFNSDGTPDTTIPMGNNATASFNYGVAGTYNISVQGKDLNAAKNCRVLSESYTTLATLPQPSINRMTAVDANNLQLDMTVTPHILYKLEIGINQGATFQVFQDIYQQSTVTIPSLLVDQNFYCFRVSAFDPCAGTNLYSNVICSQDFDVQYNNGVNNLQWNTWPAGITSVDIKRNNAQYSNIPGAPFAYEDRDYECKQEYCYQVVTNYAGGVSSTSLTKCGIGRLETIFPPIENITSVVRAGVELTWEANPAFDIQAFDIYKSLPGQPLSPFAQSTAQLYIDGTYDYAGGSCYQVNYHDACGNKSTPGIVACPMSLSGTIDDANVVTLTWNSYNGYNLGVTTYEVNKYNKSGGLLGVYPTTDTTFVDNDSGDDNQVVIYSVVAVATEPGVNKSISNNITLEKPVKLILPTAFTPNGDALNPLFTISGKFVSKMRIQIFDRWGVLVFQSDNNEPWDGTKGGKVMPESAYVWKAEVEDFAGNVFTREGTVLLLRPRR
jgi:gliding motility-associated-like protein